MLKKRLIFTLLMDKSNYMLSRNFTLQSVGNIEWIKENYDFDLISTAIDELIVLNVERGEKNLKEFSENLIALTSNCFMPVAAGGGLRTMRDAELILNSGADKLVVNTTLIEDPDFVKSLVDKYGSQCVVASIDYNTVEDEREVFIQDGSKLTGLKVEDVVRKVEKLGVGEIFLTSIKQDGTGMGYELDFITKVAAMANVSIIASGGAGKYIQFIDAIQECSISAVSTANLFNFMCDGIKDAREHMIEAGVDLAIWGSDEDLKIE